MGKKRMVKRSETGQRKDEEESPAGEETRRYGPLSAREEKQEREREKRNKGERRERKKKKIQKYIIF